VNIPLPGLSFLFLLISFPQLKEIFLIVQKLCELSGFGWDDIQHIVMASDEVWGSYLEVIAAFPM